MVQQDLIPKMLPGPNLNSRLQQIEVQFRCRILFHHQILNEHPLAQRNILADIYCSCLLSKECGENVHDENYCDDASHGARDYDCQGILNSYEVFIKLWMKGHWFGYPTCLSCDGTSPSLVVSLPSWSREAAEVNPIKSTNKITLQMGYIMLFPLRVVRRNN